MESVHIVKERQTGHSRGLAYVRFTRAYNAAMALENCDPSRMQVSHSRHFYWPLCSRNHAVFLKYLSKE